MTQLATSLIYDAIQEGRALGKGRHGSSLPLGQICGPGIGTLDGRAALVWLGAYLNLAEARFEALKKDPGRPFMWNGCKYLGFCVLHMKEQTAMLNDMRADLESVRLL